MVSTVKVDVVAPRVATGTTTLGISGDKLLVPSGVTMTNSGTLSGFPGFSKWTPVTASDATFDLQTGTTKVLLEVQASGGDAGDNSAANYEGGMGGCGAYAKKLLTGMTGATDKLNITIGAVAGAGASGTTTSVAQAGTASFTTVTCIGGAGGVSGTASAYGTGGAGGALPTTGDLNIAGTNGAGAYLGDVSSNSMMGSGGVSTGLSGVTRPGADATGYGAGGQAGINASQAGGSGSGAVVIVTEYK